MGLRHEPNEPSNEPNEPDEPSDEPVANGWQPANADEPTKQPDDEPVGLRYDEHGQLECPGVQPEPEPHANAATVLLLCGQPRESLYAETEPTERVPPIRQRLQRPGLLGILPLCLFCVPSYELSRA